MANSNNDNLNMKKDSGFSLVELVVVVLIMAIIATALTLAVTKYVAKAKKSVDMDAYDKLMASAQTAFTEYIGYGNTLANGNYVFTTTQTGGVGLTTTSGATQDMKDSVMDLFLHNANSSGNHSNCQTVTDLPVSKVSPSKCFKITVTVADDQCYYVCTYGNGDLITS